jgi:hypothetical protein
MFEIWRKSNMFSRYVRSTIIFARWFWDRVPAAGLPAEEKMLINRCALLFNSLNASYPLAPDNRPALMIQFTTSESSKTIRT